MRNEFMAIIQGKRTRPPCLSRSKEFPMYFTLSALLVLALPPRTLAQDNEAEKLFRSMEKKITEAKAFKVTVAIETGRDAKRPGSFKGFLLLTNDNKAA
jgi:hypothetical protein